MKLAPILNAGLALVVAACGADVGGASGDSYDTSVKQADEARKAGLDLLRVHPKFSVSRFVEIHAFKDAAKRRLFGEHLVTAGLPE